MSWKLGERLIDSNIDMVQEDHQLRGLKSIDSFIDQCIDWEMNVNPSAHQLWSRTKEVFEDTPVVRKVITYLIFT